MVTLVMDASWKPPWGGVSRHIDLRGGPREDSGHAGETTSLSWPWIPFGFNQKSWRNCPGAGFLCLDCCLLDPATDESAEDGWMDGLLARDRKKSGLGTRELLFPYF